MSMSPQEVFEVAPPSIEEPDATQQDTVDARSLSRGRLILRRFVRQKAGVGALIVLILIFLLAYLGPYLTHWKYDDFDQANILTGPSSNHFFGVDDIGRDVYARTLRGLQKSLIIGLAAAVL